METEYGAMCAWWGRGSERLGSDRNHCDAPQCAMLRNVASDDTKEWTDNTKEEPFQNDRCTGNSKADGPGKANARWK